MITDSVGLEGSGAGASGVNRFRDLSSEDFIRIMFTELTNQDPTEPQDSGKLLEQINSLRGIESNLELMDKIGELVGQNEFASAANLIGKFVIGRNEEQQAAQGMVAAAGIEDDKIMLTLDNGERVPFDQVEHVQLVDEENQPSG